MKFSIEGRLRNMRLPDGKTAVLYSVYEAVSNAVHAIEDRFPKKAVKKGAINVKIKTDKDGEIESITVRDNGIGFDTDNLESFDTSDSLAKYTRGGKGVGRLIWFNTFHRIHISSVFANKNRRREFVSFDYDPLAAQSICNLVTKMAPGQETYSEITIATPKKPIGQKIQRDTFLKDLALHFLPLFVTNNLPNISISYNRTTSDLNDFLDKHIADVVPKSVKIDIDGANANLKIYHLRVDPKISSRLKNSFALTAHGRVVGDPTSIAAKYALSDLPSGEAYVAIVRSKFLDDKVDQERTSFKINKEQEDLVYRAIFSEIEKYLSSHLKSVQEKQKSVVRNVLNEHPQLRSQIVSIDEYVSTIDPGMEDEKIVQNLFTLLYREEKSVKKEIAEYVNSSVLKDDEREEVNEVLRKLTKQEKDRLAELVVKRHQILQTVELLLRFVDDKKEKYAYERLVHEVICPMQKMFEDGDFDAHNLWIIDEALAYHQFIASDKPIRSFVSSDGSLTEPDILFANPLSFREGIKDSGISIVEFKRPGDEKPSSDPVKQVLGYIDQIKGHEIVDEEGNRVADVHDRTPFRAYIVTELNKGTRIALRATLAQTETPDGEGYFGFSPPHNASLEVISFRKMVDGAIERNRAYFDSLSLEQPSKAARKRVARRKKKKDAERQKLAAAKRKATLRSKSKSKKKPKAK